MSNPDRLLVNIAAKVESERSNQMPLTVVVPGAVITGRLAPERLWNERVAEVLAASDQLQSFAELFAAPVDDDAATDEGGRPAAQPTHLHLHLARILQGSYGLPHTGGMYRIAIAEVNSWTVGDLGYSDQ